MSAESANIPTAARLSAGLRPLLLLVGIAAAVAAGVAVTLWSKEPSYSVLNAGLSAEDTSSAVQALESAGIPHRVEPTSGAIAVPTDRLSDARLKLAAQGVPQGDGGFAAMSKDPGFGVSQFMESARYQHVLETELARTIASLQSVQGARVHIAKSRDSAFVRDQRPGSASVFLQLKAGRRIEAEQVTAIVNLVASSVPELTADQVTVIDNQGRLLSAPESQGEFATRDKSFEFAQRFESAYKDRVEALLAPLVGPGRVRAQIVAQVDMSSTEESREQYRPDSQIVRSEQTSEDASRAGAGAAQGIPGALSNQPPQPGVALPPGVQAPKPAAQGAAATGSATANAAAAPDNTSRQTTRNYEIDRTLAYSHQPAGRLKRLTVAVLIDNLRTTDSKGVVKETPLAKDQLERITALVKDAVGFDQARGDSVNVVNASFRGEPAEAPAQFESIPIWERPMLRDVIKIIAGLAVLIVLVLTVLRPLVRNLITPMSLALDAAAANGGAGGGARAVSGGPPPAIGYEQQIAQVRTLVNQDPKRVAQVVKGMVGKDE